MNERYFKSREEREWAWILELHHKERWDGGGQDLENVLHGGEHNVSHTTWKGLGELKADAPQGDEHLVNPLPVSVKRNIVLL